MYQADIDKMNSEFWNELCGSHLAKQLGITDQSPESLRRFDSAFFDMYPYFLPIINPPRTAGRDILEIGLGYGSLGQKLAEAGARYNGLDIAANAVRMTNMRLQMQGFDGKAVQGSAHEMPFPDNSFDFVFSIGCFHHTGNTQRCFDESFRVLRPGGKAVMMVYNKFSLRQWRRWPFFTFKELLRDSGWLKSEQRATEDQRRAADANQAGAAAPETAFLSKRQLRQMLRQFETVALQSQNADNIGVPGGVWGERFMRRVSIMLRPIGLGFNHENMYLVNRKWLLSSVGRWMGLDLYIEATKALSLGESPTMTEPTRSAA